MLTNKNDIDELTALDIEDIKYNEIEENDKWKVAMIREITDIKFKQLELENFSIEELNEILDHICTSLTSPVGLSGRFSRGSSRFFQLQNYKQLLGL